MFTPEAVPGLRISVDYFNIKVTNAIAVFGGSVSNVLNLCYNQIQDSNSVACQAVSRNSVTGIIDNLNPITVLNENSGSLETAGIDFAINYGFDLDFGFYDDSSRLTITSAATWLDKFTLVPVASLPDIINECVGAFGRTCGEPKATFKTNTTVNWETGGLNISLRHRWINSTKLDDVLLPQRRGQTGPSPDSVAVYELGGRGYVDLSVTYNFEDGLSIWGGVLNLLDNDPPLLGSRQARANTRPDTFTPTGAEFFFGASKKF